MKQSDETVIAKERRRENGIVRESEAGRSRPSSIISIPSYYNSIDCRWGENRDCEPEGTHILFREDYVFRRHRAVNGNRK